MVVVGQALRLPATDAVALQLVGHATRAQQFVYFFGCDRDTVVAGSIDDFEHLVIIW
jgi:hypothetical protein